MHRYLIVTVMLVGCSAQQAMQFVKSEAKSLARETAKQIAKNALDGLADAATDLVRGAKRPEGPSLGGIDPTSESSESAVLVVNPMQARWDEDLVDAAAADDEHGVTRLVALASEKAAARAFVSAAKRYATMNDFEVSTLFLARVRILATTLGERCVIDCKMHADGRGPGCRALRSAQDLLDDTDGMHADSVQQ